jgi:hypothetical protein
MVITGDRTRARCPVDEKGHYLQEGVIVEVISRRTDPVG